MSAQTVVILGGRVGGIVAANELARRLPEPHRVVLVERSPRHAFAPSFLWLMTGDRTAAQVTRDLRSLIRPRVEIVQAEARSIDWAKRRVEADGRGIDFDHLVIAPGDVTSIPLPGGWKPDVPLMLPKAGVFAHAQAQVVARRIAAEALGRPTRDGFCGDGYCMLEGGEDVAGFAFGNFFAEPSPDVRLKRVGRAWHLGKVLFERWWLAPVGLRRRALQAALEWGARAYGARVSL